VKLFSVMLKAIAQLRDRFHNIKLLLVGDGPDKAKLERMATELGIADRVIFAGYQANPAPFYQMMHVFCLLSATEGFGIAAVEAMHFGLPVIGSAVGGIRDVVVNNVTGR